MLLKYSDRYELSCDAGDGCREGLVFATKDFAVARRGAFEHGWQERVRKGGATKSHWACPKCVARLKAMPATLGHSTGTHGDISKPR